MNSEYYHEYQCTCDILIKFYKSDGVKTTLSTHGLGKIELIVCVGTGQRCNQSPSNIHMVLQAKKVSNVDLKALTILTKRLILDAWLDPVPTSAD